MEIEVNDNLLDVMFYFGVYASERDGNMGSYNRYIGRLTELKLELEEVLGECEKEIEKANRERKQHEDIS